MRFLTFFLLLCFFDVVAQLKEGIESKPVVKNVWSCVAGTVLTQIVLSISSKAWFRHVSLWHLEKSRIAISNILTVEGCYILYSRHLDKLIIIIIKFILPFSKTMESKLQGTCTCTCMLNWYASACWWIKVHWVHANSIICNSAFQVFVWL